MTNRRAGPWICAGPMTDARQRLVEAEDNPFMTDAGRVAELDARTARKTAADRWWWQFPDGSIVERLDADTWRTGPMPAAKQ